MLQHRQLWSSAQNLSGQQEPDCSPALSQLCTAEECSSLSTAGDVSEISWNQQVSSRTEGGSTSKELLRSSASPRVPLLHNPIRLRGNGSICSSGPHPNSAKHTQAGAGNEVRNEAGPLPRSQGYSEGLSEKLNTVSLSPARPLKPEVRPSSADEEVIIILITLPGCL